MESKEYVSFWDDKKNFYRLYQDCGKFLIEKNEEKFYEGNLIRIKKVEENPIRPIIVKNKIILYNYDKGIEIHSLDGTSKNHFDVRAVWNLASSEKFLFLQKINYLVTIDVENEIIVEKNYVSESFHIFELKGYLLFYRFKRNKTYLYNVRTYEFVELPAFNENLEIITQVQKIEDKLIVFYAAAKKVQNPIGIYIYDLKKKNGYFNFAFLPFSAYCNKYLDLINFSINDFKQKEIHYERYIDYLQNILENFGIYALIYYFDKDMFLQIEQSYLSEEIEKTIKYFSDIMTDFPSSYEKFKKLINDMNDAEEKLKNMFQDFYFSNNKRIKI